MSIPRDAPEVLDREFLEMRAKLLALAASFDRLTRGPGSVEGDPRVQQIHEVLRVLSRETADRAEQVQLIFSLDYDDQWQDKFGLPARS